MAFRKVGLDPDHPDHRMNDGQPWNVDPDDSGYDPDEPIWAVWEEAPDGSDRQWVVAEDGDLSGLTAAEAQECI